ncbi:hypothetical protein PGT21_007791 [Puccinia graminis f. sp. tritici]|uniref:DUF6818 domain-containing protein n=1 Tax=Puccinia graminis f. sp. tritici TaxID=56615 RepID=A0A5B0PXF4_PUCGR|nr:hypothetical protein PGT21_007791 [Puccinia graminis f. sp. tritici]
MSQNHLRTTQLATQATQLATQRTEPAATQASNGTNRRTGRQQGSQGYSGNDCLALVNFVKHVRPLGSNDWERVHDLYNQYALEAGRSPRDADPLKTKFRAMVASKKPTGDPDCPVWIREAKRANVMIKDRAHSIAFVDEDDEEMASDDERHGVGNAIPLSPGDPGYTERPSQSQGTLLSGWSATQSQRPDLLDDPMDESLAEYAELSQSSAGHMSTSVNPGTNPAAASINPGTNPAAASINPGTNPAAATMRPSPVDTGRYPGCQHVPCGIGSHECSFNYHGSWDYRRFGRSGGRGFSSGEGGSASGCPSYNDCFFFQPQGACGPRSRDWHVSILRCTTSGGQLNDRSIAR